MMEKIPHHGKEQALWMYCARKKIFFTFGANISFSRNCIVILGHKLDISQKHKKINGINAVAIHSFFGHFTVIR